MKPLRTLLAIYVLFLVLVIITYKDANAIELSKYYKEPLTETDTGKPQHTVLLKSQVV